MSYKQVVIARGTWWVLLLGQPWGLVQWCCRQGHPAASSLKINGRSRTGTGPSERGSLVPLLAIGLLVAVLAGSALVVSARRSAELARAQWAADAAALAAASVGYDHAGLVAAQSVAGANGAVVTMVSVAPGGAGSGAAGPDAGLPTSSWPIVVVEVERAGITAQAAATRVPALRP